MTKFDTKIVSTMLLDVMPYTNEKKIAIRKLCLIAIYSFKSCSHIVSNAIPSLVSFASEGIKFDIHWTEVNSFS